MPLLLVVAFVVVPLVELAVISQVGAAIGFWPTLLLLLADSVVGAVLVRREGRRAWGAFTEALSAGRWPGDEVVQGALVLVGGALLLTPGFVTDAAGLLMILPPTRAFASRLIRARVAQRGADALRPFGGRGGGRPAQRGVVIDVEPAVEVISVEREDDPDRDDPSR